MPTRHAKFFRIVVVLLLLLAASGERVFACYVRHARLYSGKTSDQAHNQIYYGVTMYICVGDIAHFCAEALDVYNPDSNNLKFDFDFKEGCATHPQTETMGGDVNDHNETSHVYCTAGAYGPRVKAYLDGSHDENRWDTDNCSVFVVEVNDVVENGTTDKGPLYECVEGSVTLKANAKPSGTFPTGEPHWEILPGYPAGASPILSYYSDHETTTLSGISKAGNYVVKAKCGTVDTGKTITVTAVGISSISKDKTKVCVCEPITFTANSTPSDKDLDCIAWQKQYRAESSDSWGGWVFATGGDPNAILNTSVAGQYRYHARNSTTGAWSSASGVVSVMEADKIKINTGASWEDVNDTTIVVLKGSGYTFKGYASPSGLGWPSGEPNWSGVASGTGETIDVNFPNAGTYTLRAKCALACDSGKAVTIKVKEPTVYRVGFNGDHWLYETPSSYSG